MPILCAQCGCENLADSPFREGCGGELESLCLSCGAASTAGARFCRKCGALLQGSGSGELHRLRAGILLDLDGNSVEEPETEGFDTRDLKDAKALLLELGT